MKTKRYLNAAKDRFGTNRITLSGSILVSTPSVADMLVLDSDKNKMIQTAVDELSEQFSFIDVSVTYGLADIEIKMFANKQWLGSGAFLDELNDVLGKLVAEILAVANYSVRINVFGEYCVGCKKISYRYLNKKEDVRYITVCEEARSVGKLIVNPRNVTAVIIIGVIIYCLHMWYMTRQG